MFMLVVNRILKSCQVLSDGRRYTCPIKEINGQLCFAFKKSWHPVVVFASEHTKEFVKVGEKNIFRSFKK